MTDLTNDSDSLLLNSLFEDYRLCKTAKCTQPSDHLVFCYKCNSSTPMCAEHHTSSMTGDYSLVDLACGDMVLVEHTVSVQLR